MKIIRIRISNFRCIKNATIYPEVQNVLLGPNNSGKTAVLEALNLLLNPESMFRSGVVTENDFHCRQYGLQQSSQEVVNRQICQTDQVGAQPAPVVGVADAPGRATPVTPPSIRIEAVLTGLDQSDEDLFKDYLVPWKPDARVVVESAEDGDPFSGADLAIRVVFEAWYDEEEDDFNCKTYFLCQEGQDRDSCPDFTRKHKRQVAFLIYRDFRALTRPTTLEPSGLFSRLLQSQDVVPKGFEQILERLNGALDPMVTDADFIGLLNAYKAEIERFLTLSHLDVSGLTLELTDRTRAQLKEVMEVYVRDDLPLPLQKMGAGVRSLAVLAMLTLIMRRRQRGILALEEPESFLFPHAQRRVVDECLELADQVFITTHSPYVLERVPIDGVGRIARERDGSVTWQPLGTSNVKDVNLYSKRLRQTFCEALLGRAVVVAEGDSDRWWINGASRVMNRAMWADRKQEALELQGVTVVSADSNGDLVKLGSFFRDAGLRVSAVADRVSDPAITQQLCSAGFPVIFLRQTGLERLLAEGLPIAIIRKTLGAAPGAKAPLPTPETIAAAAELELRNMFENLLIANKGSAQMHEWIISQLDPASLPAPLKELIDHLSIGGPKTSEIGPFSLLT